jgi:para-aminobenzoate synthetase/4-amino-4-deoxychorismate lyase
LLLGKSGAFAIEIGAVPTDPAEPMQVALVPLPVAADDWRLRHKTSDRAFYDAARSTSGAFEIMFVRPDGRITEGSFTNVFVERDGMFLTPRAADGLLPGILRAELLETGRAVEADLTADDLVDGFLIGNSLRGLCRAKLRRAPD